MDKIFYNWDDVDIAFNKIINIIHIQPTRVYGFPKGGLPLAVMLANYYQVPLDLELPKPNKGVLVVDDISCTGETFNNTPYIEDYTTISIFKRTSSKFNPNIWVEEVDKEWVVFPWEKQKTILEVRDRDLFKQTLTPK